MSQASATVRDWAEQNGHLGLARPRLEADEEMAATLSALAVRLTGATGFYRGSGHAAIPVMTFGPVTLTTGDGQTSVFTVEVE